MDVVVISLNPSLATGHPVKRMFPGAVHFRAVDLRQTPASRLLAEKQITMHAFETITNGRKYHHEIDTSGAVGLHRSFHSVLQRDKTSDILVCEDDCVPHALLVHMLAAFRERQDAFDMIVFGPLRYAPIKGKNRPSAFKHFDVLNSYYWGNHCLYFSSTGRSKMAQFLETPVDVHLDALFSRLAMYGDARVLIQAGGVPLAVQGPHMTTIQSWQANRPCVLCDKDPKDVQALGTAAVVLVGVLIVVLVVYLRRQMDCLCARQSRARGAVLKK